MQGDAIASDPCPYCIHRRKRSPGTGHTLTSASGSGVRQTCSASHRHLLKHSTAPSEDTALSKLPAPMENGVVASGASKGGTLNSTGWTPALA